MLGSVSIFFQSTEKQTEFADAHHAGSEIYFNNMIVSEYLYVTPMVYSGNHF